MNEFGLYILTAFALIFVIEGLVYALFPDMVRKMMAIAITMPVGKLRTFGASMALIGFIVIFVLRRLSQN